MTSHPDHSHGGKENAEFDAFASDYSGGMENSVKALLGKSGEDFLDVKLQWLLRHFPALHDRQANFTILDYGCGRGDLLRLMAKRGVTPRMLGSDISGGMLQEGAKIWPSGDAPLPVFLQQTGARVPCETASIDLVLISSVLHHVPPTERPDVYSEIDRVLRPGGHVVVFEHNPFNPVTRYVVSHTPIDENAILLKAREVTHGLHGLGFSGLKTDYIMFAPPRLRAIGAGLDRLLHWLPFGAQYAVRARKYR
jgi:SAM-dependent methyltransferase